MKGIAEMFAELSGYEDHDAALELHVARTNEGTRRRAREAKARQRAKLKQRGAVRAQDQRAYLARYWKDEEFRERRREYFRAYHARRRASAKALVAANKRAA